VPFSFPAVATANMIAEESNLKGLPFCFLIFLAFVPPQKGQDPANDL
jgi:hypothetical protein